MSTKIATAILELRTDTGQIKSGLNDVVAQSRGASQQIAAVGKTLAAAFTVTAVVAAGKQFLDFAGEVNDLSNRLKVSTDTVQRWKAAFAQSGVSVEAVAKASEQLSLKLVGGDKSAVAALEKMGLSVEKLKAMKPEDRFTAAADAVGKIQDAGERLYASKTLFGKAGPELLAGLDGHLAETIAKIDEMGLVIDSETIKAADDFGDQLGLLGQQLLGIVGTIIGPLLPALSALGAALSWLGRNIIGPVLGTTIKALRGDLELLWAAFATFLAKLADLAQRVPLVGKHLGGLAGASDWLKKSASAAVTDVQHLWNETAKVGTTAEATKPKLIGLGGATLDAGKAAKAAAEFWKQAEDRLNSFRQAVTDAQDFIGKAAANTLTQMSRFLGALRGGGFDPRTALVSGFSETSAAMMKASEVKGIPESLTGDVRLASKAFGQLNLSMVGVAASAANLANRGRTLGETLKTGIAGSLKDFPSLMVQSLTGGGGWKGAVQGLGSQVGATLSGGLATSISKNIGGLLGSTLSSIIGPLGSLLGPLLGKLGSALKGLFGGPSKKELAGRDLEKQFEQSFGGFDKMVAAVGKAYAATGRTLQQARDDVKSLLDAEKDGPEATQAWIDQINSAFDRQKAVEDGFAALASAVDEAGGTMPEALQPMIDQLLEMGNLTEEQRQKLIAIRDQGPDFAGLTKEAEGLGITVDALGPAFQQAAVNADGTKLASFFERAKTAGADVGGVILGMSDEVSELVQRAIKYGATLPETLRPVVENLFNTGKLVDENGDKIEDLSKVSFANTPLEKSTDAIVTAIDKLRELFEKMPGVAQTAATGISGALDRIKDKKVKVDIETTNTTTNRAFGQNLDGSIDYDRDPATPMIRGGYGHLSGPQLFLGGEGGPEDIVFGGAGRNLARDVAAELGGMGAPITIAPTINFPGVMVTDPIALKRATDQYLVPAIQDAITRDVSAIRRQIRSVAGKGV